MDSMQALIERLVTTSTDGGGGHFVTKHHHTSGTRGARRLLEEPADEDPAASVPGENASSGLSHNSTTNLSLEDPPKDLIAEFHARHAVMSLNQGNLETLLVRHGL